MVTEHDNAVVMSENTNSAPLRVAGAPVSHALVIHDTLTIGYDGTITVHHPERIDETAQTFLNEVERITVTKVGMLTRKVQQLEAELDRRNMPGVVVKPLEPKPFHAPGKWFPIDVMGNPMVEVSPGHWVNMVPIKSNPTHINPHFWLQTIRTALHTTDCPAKQQALTNAADALQEYIAGVSVQHEGLIRHITDQANNQLKETAHDHRPLCSGAE